MDFLGHPKALARLWACLMSDYEVVVSNFIRSHGWTFSHFAESAKNMEIPLVFHAAVGKGKRRQDQYDEVVQVILETAKDFWLTSKTGYKPEDADANKDKEESSAAAAGSSAGKKEEQQQEKKQQKEEVQQEPGLDMDVDVQEEEIDFVDKEIDFVDKQMEEIHGESDGIEEEREDFGVEQELQQEDDEEEIEVVDLSDDEEDENSSMPQPQVVLQEYPGDQMAVDEEVVYPADSAWMFEEPQPVLFHEVFQEGGNNYGDNDEVELEDMGYYEGMEEPLTSEQQQQTSVTSIEDGFDHESESTQRMADDLNMMQIEKVENGEADDAEPKEEKLTSGELVLVKRQLGGFYLTYLLYFKQPYKGLHRITLDPEDHEALRNLEKKIKRLTSKIRLQYDLLMFRLQLNKAFDVVPFADRFGLDHSTRTYLNARKSELINLIKEDKDIQDRLTQCQDVQSGQKKYQRYFEQKRLVLNESLFSVLKVACPPNHVPIDLKDDTKDVCKLVPNLRSTEAVGVMVEAATKIKKLGQQPLFTHANLLGNEAVDRIFISEACKRLKRAQAKQEKGKGDKTKKTTNPYVREGGIFGRKKEVEEGDPELRRKKERAQTSGNLWNYIGGLEFTRGRPPVPPPPDPTAAMPTTSSAASAALASTSSAPSAEGTGKEVASVKTEKEVAAVETNEPGTSAAAALLVPKEEKTSPRRTRRRR